MKPPIALVTPYLAAANNGNWQTARRWANFLAPDYRVHVTDEWRGGDEALMIALHARRSAPSIAAWRAAHPKRPLVVVLTGTDLYRDIDTDAAAQRSLRLADRLVVLNDLGAGRLPAALRDRVRVIVQSAPARGPRTKTTRRLRALMVAPRGGSRIGATSRSTTSAAGSTPRSPTRRARSRLRCRRTTGSARCRTARRARVSPPRTCSCTRAAWKAARTS